MSRLSSAWDQTADRTPVVRFIDASLRGGGQVMFQNNPVTGLLIFVAVFWGGIREGIWQVGVGALIGTLVGTATALLLRVDTQSYRQGLFGFSPVLTGIAVPNFLPHTAWMWVYLVFGAAVTTVVTLAISNFLNTWGVPALTFPFVLTSWFLMLAAYQFFRIGPGTLTAPSLTTAVDRSTAHASVDLEFLVTSILKGVSQVFLIGNWVSGVIIVIALAVNSRWAGSFALVGTIVSTLLALAVGANSASIGEGLFGFSAVLTAIALGCTYYKPGIAVTIYALFGTVFTLIIQAGLDTALAPLGIPSFTAPFVFATWLFLLPKRNLTPTPHHKPIHHGVVGDHPTSGHAGAVTSQPAHH